MMADVKHLKMVELEAGLEQILEAPDDEGVLAWIVSRPDIDRREALEEGHLDIHEGLVGDSWKTRGSSRTPDHSPHPDMQITLMNARVIELLAQEKERWQLAGDQLYVDLDLSTENLPVGTQLELGEAVIEVTGQAHTGCDKFAARFGVEALKFVNAPQRRQLHLRGVYARVVRSGAIRVGEPVRKRLP